MAEKHGHISQFNLKIDGAQADTELMNRIIECTVENSLHLPDMCTIQLHDSDFKQIDEATLDPGKKIEIFAGNEDMPSLVKIFCGEVTALDFDLAADATPMMTVRAYDYSHRLQRGRNTQTFNNVTDSDIVQQVGQKAGFNVHADSTSAVHDWILQKNKTNWEFLQERAMKNGFRLYVQDEKDLYFCKVDNDKIGPYSSTGDGSGDAAKPDQQQDDAGVIKLEWGKSLRSFRPRLKASGQVGKVIVKGWDPQAKQAIVGNADTPKGVPQIGLGKNGGQMAGSAFNDGAEMVVTDRPVHSQAEADTLAQSVMDSIGGKFIDADGVCYGVPTLRAGKTISIANIGQRFSGKYPLTSVTHTYTPGEGYKTNFSITAKTPHTLLSVMSGGGGGGGGGGGAGSSSSSPDTGAESPDSNNIMVGVVTDNNDPSSQGRIKVNYPWLSANDTSYWARIVSPMAGSGRGIQFLPEIGDEVLVAFEHGDPTRPYILGALWNGSDSPPYDSGKSVAGGNVVRHIIHTRTGHMLEFLEADSETGFRVTTAGNHTIDMSDLNKVVTVKTKMGHTVEMSDADQKILIKDYTGADSIEIDCTGQITLTAAQNITLQAGMGITLQAGANMSMISGANYSVTSGASMALTSGASAALTSGADMALSSGGTVAITSAGVLAATAGGTAAISSAGELALTASNVAITGTLLVDGIPVP